MALLHYSTTKKQFNMNCLLNQREIILALLKITVHYNIIQKGDGGKLPSLRFTIKILHRFLKIV